MIQKILISLCMLVAVTSCSGQSGYASAEPVNIRRFDKELYRLIETGDTTIYQRLREQYPEMLQVFGKAILNMKSPDQPGFWGKMMGFFFEPTLKSLYKEAITRYDDVSEIEKELGVGFAWLKEHLPSMQMPTVYMHVSGFNQNILVGEGTLSLSVDKYMGFDYHLYQDYFYEYQRRKMQPALIVPDYLTGWLMAEFPFTGKENVLLERMVYEGKMKYLVSHALPDSDPALLMGYTAEELQWVKEHEGSIWKAIIERKHLYTPDHITTGRYFEELPSFFLSDDAPGNIGVYIGWQIVNHYMKETGATPDMLLQQTNAQDVLTAAKYKP